MENRLQDLYWAELVQLKVSCEYMRRYRDSLGTWVTRFAVIRAVVAVSALGTWAAVKSYPMLWGGIIVAAQIADACQNALPLASRYRGTTALVVALEALLIDSQMEWEDIYAARVDRDTVVERRHKLMQLRREAEAKCIPNGVPARKTLFALAEMDAATYFMATHKIRIFK